MSERSRGTDRRPAPGSAPLPPDRDEVWTAEIEWRLTDAGARFCVIARARDRNAEVNVAESSPLNWPPRRGESVRALSDATEKLEAALLDAGWRPLPPGSAWYAKRFMSEPAAEAAPAVRLGPAAPAPPVWVQPVGPEAPARPREPDAPEGGRGEGVVVHGAVRGALVALAVVAAAVAGVLLARALAAGDGAPAARPAATPLTIDHDGLRLQVPSGWARGVVARVPGFRRPLMLENADERLTAVVERLPATSTTLLPRAFERALPAARERRERARLAPGRRVWRYRVSQADGAATVVYTAPTTSGVATLACTRAGDGEVPAGCEALAAALTVPRALPLDPGTSAAFLSRLPLAVEQLEAARSAGTRSLAAAERPAEQAAAAERLASGHRAASAALAPLVAARTGLPAKVVGTLDAAAAAYARLAAAARARSPRGYDEAVRVVAGADAGLRRALSQAAAATDAAGGAAP